jgi:putative ABC transport system permease protein
VRTPAQLSVRVGLQTLQQSPLHTLLSTLGIVVGVASLVAILSLGDGMERFAREQIESTTDLQLVIATPRTTEVIDGIQVQKPSYPTLEPRHVAALQQELGRRATVTIALVRGSQVGLPGGRTAGAILTGTTASALAVSGDSLVAGRFLDAADSTADAERAVLTTVLAEKIDSLDPPTGLVGRTVLVDGAPAEVIGVVRPRRAGSPTLYLPLGSALVAGRVRRPAALLAKAAEIEDVPAVRAQLEGWLAREFGSVSAFDVITNDARVGQAQRGVLLFKLVMGAITGISIVVGGIGIMNVLLVSITQRTREIGVRRATGARRRDILVQFLAESIAISGAGSLLGLTLGFATIFTVVPIVRRLTEIPFQAGFSVSTVVVAVVAAIVVGVLFGTYPAWRAANLSPVDAIRHE